MSTVLVVIKVLKVLRFFHFRNFQIYLRASENRICRVSNWKLGKYDDRIFGRVVQLIGFDKEVCLFFKLYLTWYLTVF